jgi:hypothetical protein
MSTPTLLALAETLTKAGWEIVKFEDLGGGAMLTIMPKKQEAGEAGQ